MPARPREIVLVTDERNLGAQGRPPHGPVLEEERLLAEALRELGFAAPRVAWSDPAIDWARPRAALLRSTWDYSERPAEFLAWLARAAAATRVLNDPAIVRWNLDKRYLIELARAGVAVVPTERIERGGTLDLPRRLAAAGAPALIVKPAVSGAARETWRVDAGNLAERAPRLDALLRREALLVQPFVDAVRSAGELSFVLIDGRCRHAVRKRAKPGDFRVQDDHGGTVEPHAPGAAELDFAQRAVAAAPGRPLYARVDAVETGRGLLLMELELIEPELFFRFRPRSAVELAQACVRELGDG